jgi:hypothetical protein
MGDYNQRISKKYSSVAAYNALVGTFSGFDTWTTGIIKPIEKQSIDHFSTRNIEGKISISSIDNFQNGIRVSDHFGLIVNISG